MSQSEFTVEDLLKIVEEAPTAPLVYLRTLRDHHEHLKRLDARRNSKRRASGVPSLSSDNSSSSSEDHRTLVNQGPVNKANTQERTAPDIQGNHVVQKLHEEEKKRRQKVKEIVRVIQESPKLQLPQDVVSALQVCPPWIISRPSNPFTDEETKQMKFLLGLGCTKAATIATHARITKVMGRFPGMAGHIHMC
eukprot:TRINITY_DN115511_c0_g1_i1.p1 TRINITY_DN115511_c0_g1~~TRINITY_DN115511_c0_g1_i1.p1  ORF type:complete len:193 (-),score=6.05 TRINITY_DN115511_c0_g1_i1:495-1073(-)